MKKSHKKDPIEELYEMLEEYEKDYKNRDLADYDM